MLTIVSDTHSRHGHALEGAVLEAVRDADTVVHSGDFTSESALEAFRSEARELVAVHGNADDIDNQLELPETATLTAEGATIAVTHTRPGGEAELVLFGKDAGADVVVSGHTHQPALERVEGLVLCNPGSHTQPRGNRPGYATLEGGTVTLRNLEGTAVASLSV